jgi:hypothetical protein
VIVAAAAVAVVEIGSGTTGSVEVVYMEVTGYVLVAHIVTAAVGVAYIAADRAVAEAAEGFLGVVSPGNLGNRSLDLRRGLHKLAP